MARQRLLHPEIWVSENFIELTHQQRLLFIGMISLSDDEGRIKANPKYLKASIFPADNIDPDEIRKDLITLQKRGNVLLYKSEGGEFACLPKWKKYQKPKYPQPSKLPTPPEVNSDLNNQDLKTSEKRFPSTSEALPKCSPINRIVIDSNSIELDSIELDSNSINKENSIKEEISNFYTSLTGRLCNGNDTAIITEIFNSINPLNYTCGLNIIKKVMSDVFQYKSKQEPPNNKINGLKFFRDPVLIALKKAKPSAPGNGGREGGRYISNDLTAEIEQEMREFEIRKREIEEAKRKEVIVSG